MTAQERANETRQLNGIEGEAYRRADSEYSGDRVWVVMENETSAVIVYEDDPDSVCSVSNRPGRFTECN